jgi:L-ascorbate metabolism protein UlaG (beta-lactamase superfamily)
MKLTKYEHASFTLEKDGEVLVVDPGVFTTDFAMTEHVTGVVITHEHADHFDRTLLDVIVTKNPQVTIIGHDTIMQQINDLPTISVNAGDAITIGTFVLEFFGGEHAVIHESFTPIANLGVLINQKVYYPGDSFTVPNKPVDVLALPVAAPWMKISEAFDFVANIKPRIAFPTHDAILSDAGKSLPDRMLPPHAESFGTSYQRLSAPLHIDD